MSLFEHPQLGSIKHAGDDDVRLFLGLKYASLEHPFAAPQVHGETGDQVDATQHGSTAISPPFGCDFELGHIQKTLPREPVPFSGTDCLNLNLCVPKSADSKRPLPVLVYIHGGGFMVGANSWPQYDLKRFVKHSAEIGNPVIAIMINYRLGIYGFLDSGALRSAGVPSNRGLRDQRAAFQWVQDNIAGFGGDPARVTVVGESAGGVSITLHLQSQTPLFAQCVPMGGSAMFMKPLPAQVAEATCQSVLGKLGIDASSNAEELLRKLCEVDPQDVLKNIGPGVPLLPVDDGEIVHPQPKFTDWAAENRSQLIPGTKWCSRAMAGDCQFDASILAPTFAGRTHNIATTFSESMSKHLQDSPEVVAALLDSYNITPTASDDEALLAILFYINDLNFFTPVQQLAHAWPASAFVYHFNEPNPWEGPNKGRANHILDVAFLFQNFNEFLDPEQCRSAKRFAEDLISFVAGEEPFPAREGGRGARVYGLPGNGEVGFVSSEGEESYGRRGLVKAFVEKAGFEKLSGAVDMFIAGM